MVVGFKSLARLHAGFRNPRAIWLLMVLRNGADQLAHENVGRRHGRWPCKSKEMNAVGGVVIAALIDSERRLPFKLYIQLIQNRPVRGNHPAQEALPRGAFCAQPP